LSGNNNSKDSTKDLITRGQTTGRKDDSGKPPMALIPPIALEAMARAFQNGLKYGQYNYMRGLEATRIVSALMRHVSKWNGGEELDKESGVHHLGHAGACICMLLHLQSEGKLVDDRWRHDGTAAPEFSVFRPVDSVPAVTKPVVEVPKKEVSKKLALQEGKQYRLIGGEVVTLVRRPLTTCWAESHPWGCEEDQTNLDDYTWSVDGKSNRFATSRFDILEEVGPTQSGEPTAKGGE